MRTLIVIALLALTACNETGGGTSQSAKSPADPASTAPADPAVIDPTAPAPSPSPAPAPIVQPAADCSALSVVGTWTAITSTVTLAQDSTDTLTINADCTAHSTYCDMDFVFTPPGSADWLDDHEVKVRATTASDGRSGCDMPNGVQPYLSWADQGGYFSINYFRVGQNFVKP